MTCWYKEKGEWKRNKNSGSDSQVCHTPTAEYGRKGNRKTGKNRCPGKAKTPVSGKYNLRTREYWEYFMRIFFLKIMEILWISGFTRAFQDCFKILPIC